MLHHFMCHSPVGTHLQNIFLRLKNKVSTVSVEATVTDLKKNNKTFTKGVNSQKQCGIVIETKKQTCRGRIIPMHHVKW